MQELARAKVPRHGLDFSQCKLEIAVHWPHTQTLDYYCRHSMATPGDILLRFGPQLSPQYIGSNGQLTS